METSRVALIALVCVVFSGQKRISGAEVEPRVRRGDDVTLYSDCVVKSGFYPVWFRNCSHQNQPRLMISYQDLMRDVFPRYLFVFNVSTNLHDLLIKKVTESDVGVYYCAVMENIITKDKDGVIISTAVFHYGNRWTRLSVLVEASPGVTVSPNTPTPCVSEWSVSWKLVLGVCAVCVLLSSLLSSICVYCLCTNTTKGEIKAGSAKRTTLSHDEVGDEVCYASLDIQNLHKKKKRKIKRRVQHSDFSTYSEVRTDRSSGDVAEF